MNLPTILIVCAVLAAASSLATCHNLFDPKYLDSHLLSNRAMIERTKNALLAMGVGEGDDYETISQLSKSLLSHVPYETHEYDVYLDLHSLSAYPKRHLNRVTARVIEICEILEDPTFILQMPFAQFLLQFGPSRFRTHAPQAIQKLEGNYYKHRETILELDQIFAISLGLQTYTDQMLLQKLTQFDFTEGEFDVNIAFRVALSGGIWKPEQMNDPLFVVKDFIEKKCGKFRKHNEYSLSTIALAVTFNYPRDDIPITSNKMIEYIRLCKSLRSEQTMKNLKGQLRRHNVFSTQYLDWSILNENWNVNIEETKTHLHALMSPFGGVQEDILTQIRTSFNGRIRNLSGHKLIVYEDLLQLTFARYQYKDRMAMRVMEICAILDDPTFQPQEELANFLYEQGRKKFGTRLMALLNRLDHTTRAQHDAAWALDELIARSSGWDTFNEEAAMNILSSFDLATSDFEIDKAIEVIGRLESWSLEERQFPLDMVYAFIADKCGKLRQGRENYILTLTLAVTFGFPTNQLPIKINQLKEYNRLCATLFGKRDMVMANLTRLYMEYTQNHSSQG